VTNERETMSYLALDQRSAAGEPTDRAALPPHARTHLERLNAPRTVPGWALGLAHEKRRSAPRWLVPALAAAVTLGGVLLFFDGMRRADEQTASLRAKGPAVAVVVYVKRNGQVRVWDGRAALRPEDELRLRVTASGFEYVSVIALDEGESPALLYSTRIEPTESEVLLPVAWRVDSQGSRERLRVVFGPEPVEPGSAGAWLSGTIGEGRTHIVDLDFPKEQ